MSQKLQPEKGKIITKENMLCRLVLSNDGYQPHCNECLADAEVGWMPVREMKEIWTRACGDDCTCLIEFEDEYWKG